ncbi:hypothetical protein [Phenylobacterium sp.]|jgi:uncharacterized membrane protein|uniref:hypothetical protein n=1 Tax=Phenylobacterium sp. TaxID=1871053 RepID=UPI002F9290FF
MATEYLGARATARPTDTSMNLAMLGYGLLFLSVFFAGLTALVAVVIAYSQKDAAPKRIRSHFNFQIRMFWIALALTLGAAACASAGVVAGLGQIVDVAAISGFDGVGNMHVELSDVTIDSSTIALLGAALVLGLLSTFWLIVASSIGFVRLASEPIGQ